MSPQSTTSTRTALVVWRESRPLALELLHVLKEHCTCHLLEAGRGHCGAHDLLFDQRSVDGLLFGRWLAVRLMREEFHLDASQAA